MLTYASTNDQQTRPACLLVSSSKTKPCQFSSVLLRRSERDWIRCLLTSSDNTACTKSLPGNTLTRRKKQEASRDTMIRQLSHVGRWQTSSSATAAAAAAADGLKTAATDVLGNAPTTTPNPRCHNRSAGTGHADNLWFAAGLSDDVGAVRDRIHVLSLHTAHKHQTAAAAAAAAGLTRRPCCWLSPNSITPTFTETSRGHKRWQIMKPWSFGESRRHKPSRHVEMFATKSVTSSRQSRGFVADTNHESPRQNHVADFHDLCPRLCRELVPDFVAKSA